MTDSIAFSMACRRKLLKGFKYCYSSLMIRLHTVKWFYVLICITNTSIKHQSFVCTLLSGFKYCYVILTIQCKISHLFNWFNSSVWPIDETQKGSTFPSQRGPGSNSNEGVRCILQSSSTTEASPSVCLVSYPRHTLQVVLPLCRDAVGVFYNRS